MFIFNVSTTKFFITLDAFLISLTNVSFILDVFVTPLMMFKYERSILVHACSVYFLMFSPTLHSIYVNNFFSNLLKNGDDPLYYGESNRQLESFIYVFPLDCCLYYCSRIKEYLIKIILPNSCLTMRLILGTGLAAAPPLPFYKFLLLYES